MPRTDPRLPEEPGNSEAVASSGRISEENRALARPEGLEPSTPGLEGRCSIQLSYGRMVVNSLV